LAARAAFIVRSLEDFESELEAAWDESTGGQSPVGSLGRLAILQGRYTYPGPEGAPDGFSLIKVRDFHLDRRELVILRGGNGSGKGTFMRLSAGLTRFQEGDILVDGVSSAALGPQNYRTYFSAVFPDFHLFPGVYGLNAPLERVREELARVGLGGKIAVNDQVGFSALSLSSGQRKRLGLVCAILE
jgi:putative ATP-binding cassette transporter